MPFKTQVTSCIGGHRGFGGERKRSTNDPQISEIGSDYGVGYAVDNRSEKSKNNNIRIASDTL